MAAPLARLGAAAERLVAAVELAGLAPVAAVVLAASRWVGLTGCCVQGAYWSERSLLACIIFCQCPGWLADVWQLARGLVSWLRQLSSATRLRG